LLSVVVVVFNEKNDVAERAATRSFVYFFLSKKEKEERISFAPNGGEESVLLSIR